MTSVVEERQMDFPGMPKPKPEILEKTPDSAEAAHPAPHWLGLVVDHRRLFDALQDGWLRPRAPSAGLLTGVGTHADDPDAARSGHPIPVRIKLDAEKLPALDVSVLRGSQWIHLPFDVAAPSDIAVYWPGPLPVFAISELEVAKEEERARLKGMARQFSNVELPDVPVTVRNMPAPASVAGDGLPPIPPTCKISKLDVPAEVDPLHGAMSMAVWAVPRIAPWLDILVASLSSDHERLPKLTAAVEAGWWRFPPWTSPASAGQPRDSQDRLWLAAVEILRRRSIDGGAPPRALAEQIAEEAERLGISSGEASDWLRTTQRILRAESVIKIDDWRACPVGMAVQLVLTRPEPTRFRTWHQDSPNLPPAVWWSAAALCGLHHGYRKLDVRFRGTAEQRAFIAVHALRTCTRTRIRWPSLAGEPHWRRTADGFALLWGDTTISHRPYKAHGRWYAVHFDDAKVRNSALRVAKELGWPCWTHRLVLEEGSRLPFSGSLEMQKGRNRIRESAPGAPPATSINRARSSTGEILVKERTVVELPPGQTMEEVLDVESFRQLVVVAGARLPEPPSASMFVPAVEQRASSVERLEEPGVPGLTYVPNFLDEAEEKHIIEQIDRGEWIEDLQRRVQHYGWRYDYKARRVDPEMRLGELPAWADDLAQRLFAVKLVPNRPDQVIVNEYRKDQGIGRHIDSKSFADGIATVSLLESWEMRFRRKRGKGERPVDFVLQQRSVAVIEGEARYGWTHEIPKRKLEPSNPDKGLPKRKRGRRVSLTFRKVVEGNR